MSELHKFATAVLASWHADHGVDDGPIPVADLLDRVFPYSLARRRLGIDASEDYEALALRLIAGQEDLAVTTPADAAELARSTMEEKLPDLTVLQLLRGAQVTLRVNEVSPTLAAPPPSPAPAPPSVVASDPVKEKWKSPMPSKAKPVAAPAAAPATPVAYCWSCSTEFPAGRAVKFCVQCGADQRPLLCSQCNEVLERTWKHCPECGTRTEGAAA